LVGPEPDFSVRYSDLEKAPIRKMLGFAEKTNYMDTTKRPHLDWLVPLWDKRISGNKRDIAAFRPKAGCYRTREMSDQEVLRWTEFAMQHGIRYKGKRSYDFSQATTKPRPLVKWVDQLFFKEKKLNGWITPHSRSSDSRQRRSAVRRAKFRQSGITVLSIERTLGNRKVDFSAYKKSGSKESFKAFRNRLEPRVCLRTQTSKSVISGVTLRALENLYKFSEVIPFIREPIPTTCKVVISKGIVVTDTPLDRSTFRIPCYPDVITGKSLDKKGFIYRIDAGLYYNVVGGLSMIG
jgi:hypothetical protein